MSEYKISVVLPDQILVAWEKILPWLEPVCEISDGRMSAAETLDRALKGLINIWVIYDPSSMEFHGALTTRVTPYAQAKYLTIEMLGGDDFFSWRDDLQSKLVLLAKSQNCDGLELVGRAGWERALKDLGWEKKFSTCQFRIDQ